DMSRAAPAWASRIVATTLVCVGLVLFVAPVARAQTSTTQPADPASDTTDATDAGGGSTLPPTTTSTSLPGATDIGYGYSFTGAVINAASGVAVRRLNAYQAAAFMQSWFAGGSIASQNQVNQPPVSADIYRVDVTGNWDDQSGTMTVYYASNGQTAWI